MAINDMQRRTHVLDEWNEELNTSQGNFENFDISRTGLGPVKREIIATIERLKQLLASQRQDYSPFTAVNDASSGTR